MRFALIDQHRQLAPHLVRNPAGVLAAFTDVGVAAGAACADDFVLELPFEVVARVVRRPDIVAAQSLRCRVLLRRDAGEASKRRDQQEDERAGRGTFGHLRERK